MWRHKGIVSQDRIFLSPPCPVQRWPLPLSLLLWHWGQSPSCWVLEQHWDYRWGQGVDPGCASLHSCPGLSFLLCRMGAVATALAGACCSGQRVGLAVLSWAQIPAPPLLEMSSSSCALCPWVCALHEGGGRVGHSAVGAWGSQCALMQGVLGRRAEALWIWPGSCINQVADYI